jgi:hypothetical protein
MVYGREPRSSVALVGGFCLDISLLGAVGFDTRDAHNAQATGREQSTLLGRCSNPGAKESRK